MAVIIAAAAIGYLLGSVPFGLVLTRLAGLGDVRKIGSGSIGATNVLRTGNKAVAALTLLLDVAKGVAAPLIGAVWGPLPMLAAGAAVVVGHMFPVWLGFRGGKGVATGLGSFVMLAPKTILLMLGIFIAVVVIFRYVSLGSIVAVAVFPGLAWFLNDYDASPFMLLCMGTASVVIVLKHSTNIQRLLTHTEPRFHARSA